MLLTRRRSWVSALLLSASLLNAPSSTRAEDEAPRAKPGAAAKDEAAEDKPLAPPEGNDAKALKLYLTRVMRTQPKQQSPEAITKFLERVRAAGELILSRDVDDDQLLAQAASLQMQALETMAELGDETALERLAKLKDALSKDKRPGVAAVIEVTQFGERLAQFEEMKPEERKKLVEELAAKLDVPKIIPDFVSMTRTIGMLYEEVDQPEEAKQALNLFADRLEARKDDEPEFAAQLKKFIPGLRSAAKRLDMIGRPIEIKGTALDGQPFDVASWKGKVVLVDFWATWCGPCLQEMPNVIRHYKAYHDKGFEVVGISLDESGDDLKEFVKERKIPWINLFDEKSDNQGWSNPIARQYGISSIPACILVDQKGNVVSLNARGPKLGELLARLLGPVEIKEEAEAK